MSFFSKLTDQLTTDDVSWLVSQEIEESQEIEFKADLPGDNPLTNSWEKTGSNIGRDAITACVKELTAFANAGGGTLVLGVQESQDKPHRAAKLAPLRDATELAERLRRRCRDNIEPKLYGLEAKGIVAGGDGRGFVVLRVPASPRAPHRSNCDNACYVRRRDESMSMTMEEIQQMVLDVSRRGQKVEDRLASLRITEGERIPPQGEGVWQMRSNAVPQVQLFVPDIYRKELLRPKIRIIPVVVPGLPPLEANFLAESHDWRPLVRGAQSETTAREHWGARLRIFADGAVSFDHSGRSTTQREPRFYIGWGVGMFGNTLLAIERMRLATGALSAPYVLEFELRFAGQSFGRFTYGQGHFENGTFPANGKLCERYEVLGRETFDELTRLFAGDLNHLAGVDDLTPVSFDYAPRLREIDGEFQSS